MSPTFFTFFLVLFLKIVPCFGINILLFITALGHSHVYFNGRIADVLIDAGHNVTVFHLYLDPDVTSRATDRAANYILYKAKGVDFSGFMNMTSKTSACFNPDRPAGTDLPMLFATRMAICETLVNDDELWQTLKSTKFDLAIGEYFEECQEGVFEVLNIPTTIMTSAISMYNPVFETHGIPNMPSFIPSIILPFTPQMTLKQRIINMIVYYKIEQMHAENDRNIHGFYKKKFGPDFPTMGQLRKQKTAFSFINANEHIEFALPMTTKVKFIGGMQPRKAEEIPEKMLKVIESKKGFVIVSFGTFARSHLVPEHIRQGIVAALKNFPDYAFFWKYSASEGDDLAFLDETSNIHLEAWIPQHALLNHPKCKSFITHAGMNSVIEAAMAGVPMITVPLFTDQLHNAAVIAKKKIGILLGRENLNQVGLTLALQQVLKDSDSVFQVQAKIYAERIKDSHAIMSPEQMVVKYVEYAHLHGSMPDMDLSSAQMNFFQVYLLDIFIPLFLLMIFGIVLFVYLIKTLLKSKTVSKNKNE